MPISYSLDKTRQFVRTTVDGRVTVSEIIGHLEAVRRDDALAFAELIDADGAARPFLSATDVWRAATHVRTTQLPSQLGPRAVIVSDDTAFGLTRIFTNILTGIFPIEAFRSRERAEEWLAGWSRPSDAT
jgi:hypothetical protein